MEAVEGGMRFVRGRAALLADDVANARTPGFVPRDAALVQSDDPAHAPFAVVMKNATTGGPASVLEFAMGAQARNAVMYRALTDQEHAMLRELRTVAEESRR